MIDDNILKKYDVLCINRKNKELAKDIKDEIDDGTDNNGDIMNIKNIFIKDDNK